MPPPTTEVTIRAAALSDIPAIVAVQARSWRTTYRGLVEDTYLDDLPLQEWVESWRAHLVGGGGDTYCVVAERDGRVVGFASVGPAHDADLDVTVGELHTIYIDAALQGTGLGRRLLSDVASALARAGCREAVVWVLQGNSRAIRFYEAAGLRLDGTSSPAGWRGTLVPRVRLRGPLRPPVAPTPPPG